MGLFEPTKKQLGEQSQAHIIARLLEVGYTVLTPYGDSSRYDLVIEDAESQFWRVQCKTAWIEGGDNGYIKFATTSLRSRSTNGKVQYSRARYAGANRVFRSVQPLKQWGIQCVYALRHRKTTRKKG